MQELFAKYLNNECSPEEVKELLSYFIVFGNEKTLRNLIVENLADQDLEDEDIAWNPALDKTFAVIKSRMNVEKGKVVPLFRRSWVRIAAAVIFLLGGFAVFSLIKKTNPNQDIVKINSSKPKQNAGSNKAVLSLANGSNIILETVENGTVTKQGGTEIIKLAHGQLVYKLLNEKPDEVLFNSIKTPRGGQYEVILSDGSKVWLNAASSLRFPAGFNGNERKVELSGEAYFEVAKNASMPFKVEIAGKGEVEVLGTHFNINAYSDEITANTTLIEGSVKVMGFSSHKSHIINPGEQAQIHGNGQITIKKEADARQAMVWKDGTFNFNNADLRTVLRQLSRWYDVDIQFKGAVPERKFNGEIQRDLDLSQVLKLLEKNEVFCRLEGKTLVVLQ